MKILTFECLSLHSKFRIGKIFFGLSSQFMTSNKTASAVQQVYRELDNHLFETTAKTGMRCVPLCSLCCSTKNIEASPLEFIPFAAWLYESGKVDEFLIRLDKSDQTGHCPLFLPDAWREGKGACWKYDKRGLICRLFGFGYRLTRDNLPDLVTCKVLKENDPEGIAKAGRFGIENPDSIPLFRNYSMQLYSIDQDLALPQLPINKAIRLAIEKMYFHYMPFSTI
jgi:hypothetical protein